MPDPNDGFPPRYLRTSEAARFLGLSGRTLEKQHRSDLSQAGRPSVVYSLDDLKAWVDRGAKTSTSDPGIGTVLPAKRHRPIPYVGKERRRPMSDGNSLHAVSITQWALAHEAVLLFAARAVKNWLWIWAGGDLTCRYAATQSRLRKMVKWPNRDAVSTYKRSPGMSAVQPRSPRERNRELGCHAYL